MTMDHGPDNDDIQYRGFNDPASGEFHIVSLCKHLRAELDGYLKEAIATGVALKLSKEDAARLDIETIMPVDLNEEEQRSFARQATKFSFWQRGNRKCPTCGHVARGKLAQSKDQEQQRWRRTAMA